MAVLLVIVSAIIPIAFVILLGVLAGLTGLISPKNSNVLAVLALNFCLPALLFAATATMTIAELSNWRFFLGIALGLLVIYATALAISLTVFIDIQGFFLPNWGRTAGAMGVISVSGNCSTCRDS